jgi:hypothetical protein
MFAGMAVPKTPVNKECLLALNKCDIGFSGKVFAMDSITGMT